MNFKKSRTAFTSAILTFGVAFGTVATGLVVTAPSAEAAVVRPFALNYNETVPGDVMQVGNGNMICPGATAPVDPFGEPIATCAGAQAGTNTSASAINDSYYMQWVDVDSSAATYNSSQATVTIPSGASVSFARLRWSGDTGTIRLADSTISTLPGCNTRQFLGGAGTAVLPSGTPESTSARLTVGAGSTTAVAPQVISRDALANVPASQPQLYAAQATVTNQFAGIATGVPVPITVGNLWTPQGFGCYAGWSLTLVYSFGDDDMTTPSKQIFIYDGHVRQSSVDPPTSVPVSGLLAAGPGSRVSLTAFEGDGNIGGDQFLVNGTNTAEPLTGATSNFFNSRAEGATNPAAVASNLSVDSKSLTVPIASGATAATFSFTSAGDTYLASGLVLAVPRATLRINASAPAGPHRAGDSIEYTITVRSPAHAASGVAVDSEIPGCDRNIGALAADVPHTYTCTAPAPGSDTTYANVVSGDGSFGQSMEASRNVAVAVVNPAIEITKTADKANYLAGETITFSIEVVNAGDVPLTSIAVTDAKVPACDNTHAALAVGASLTYTCTAIAPIAGNSNTASVNATSPVGAVSDSSTVAVPMVGTISGRVFADRNGNGQIDAGDTGISGVTLTLTGPQPNRTTTSGPDGGYSFAGVPGGTYTLTQTQPAGFDDGIDTAGSNAALNGNDTMVVTLSDGASSAGALFAERPTASLAGAVYVDRDRSGTRDGGEPGVRSVTMLLNGEDEDGNAVTLSTVTDPGTGEYRFASLRAGSYEIAQMQPTGYGDGSAVAGTAGGSADNNAISDIDLSARTAGTGYLFGETVGSLAGGVYADSDRDGTRDPGESGIGGVTVTLTGTDPDGSISPIQTTTRTDGSYRFEDLLAGTYAITKTPPSGYREGSPTLGSAGGNVSSSTLISGIDLEAAGRATGYLFGQERGSLAGTVWSDDNGNGVRDAGESGVEDVAVRLYSATPSAPATQVADAGAPVATVRTDADGDYSFGDLAGGSYQVGVELAADQALTVPGRGDAQTGSDIDWIAGLSDELVIDYASDVSANLRDLDAGLIVRADDLAVDLQLQQGAAKAAGKARMKAGTGLKVGDTVDLAATVTNRGASPAMGVRLTVTLPSGLRPDSADGDDWTCTTAAQSTECLTAEPVLPGDALPTVTLRGTAVSTGTGSISAVVAFTNGSTDVTQADNVAAAALTIKAAPVPPVDPDDETDDPEETDDPDGTPGPTGTGALPQVGAGATMGPAIGAGLVLLAAGLLVMRRRRRLTGR
ncbi:SdrD B-like domain-containing protein [Nocardioides sp. Bht2]|uniref:SdrD B-like domain-containing protein n=1 Tax=Nocardioides sp. Bht2 TaxID=3392297 RepID=UPI0039B5A320